MKKITLTFATLLLVSQFSFTFAADPSLQQAPSRPMTPQRGSTIPQLQITPDYLYQQITALKQQVQILQAQVNSLRSVVQITTKGTTIAADYLTIKGDKNLDLTTSMNMGLTANGNLALTVKKNITLISAKDISSQAGGQLTLISPQIRLNNGTKAVAAVGSSVSGGKVITGSTSVFVPQ